MTINREGMFKKVGEYQIRDSRLERIIRELKNAEKELIEYDKLLNKYRIMATETMDQSIAAELKEEETKRFVLELKNKKVPWWSFKQKYKIWKSLRFIKNNDLPGGNLAALLNAQRVKHEKN